MNQNHQNKNIRKILISEKEIQNKISEAGNFINQLYDGKPILLVSILKGGFIFLADVARKVHVPCEIGFMTAQSYFDKTCSSGHVEITMDLQQDISDYHVVLIEDIIDTGRTLAEILKILNSRNPLSLHMITLLDKPSRRIVNCKPDLALFQIPDVFVVGYGMDYGEKYRNLPYIAELQ
ncbi:MAG: hypoxanthine phosphoribosyltransferase [Oscillospiraceae bacterium]|nr:hypoxanthine phosphoribosyltransferase [Oscillospiraceae bacterium]MDE5883635.1 hypoxanthine phosphoribosyltransferase [Oscillospiraceae bacterium]